MRSVVNNLADLVSDCENSYIRVPAHFFIRFVGTVGKHGSLLVIIQNAT